jgi:hypothetical protein
MIEAILSLPDGPDKTVRIAAWIQSRFPDPTRVPILVGGAAVEIVTGGAYTTGDLDFVGSVDRAVSNELERAGFRRHGRHWIHEDAQVFVEFPGESLGPSERSEWVAIGELRIRMVSLEDLLVDRLGAWQHWQSSVDGANAWAVWRAAQDRVDTARLHHRIREEGWQKALERLISFANRWSDGEPTAGEVEAWALQWP